MRFDFSSCWKKKKKPQTDLTSLWAYVEQTILILVSKINLWQIPLMLAYIYATLKNLC